MRLPWQTKQASGLLSTSMNSDSHNTGLPPNQPASLLPGTYHQSCSTLLLSHFFEIMITGDLSWLIINGNTLPSQLEEAWDTIIAEYTSLIKTEKTDDIFMLYKKIKQTQFLMDYVDKCIDALKVKYDADLAAWLGEKGFGEVEYSTDRDVYLRSLFGIKTSAKVLVVLLNQYNAEYKLLNKDNEVFPETETEKRFRYEKEVAELSRYQGQRINKQITVVLEYAAIINNYLEYIKINKPVLENG